jgi:hypothetical protein
MTYMVFMAEVVKMSVLYWPEVLIQELLLSQLNSSLAQRENRPSIAMEEA